MQYCYHALSLVVTMLSLAIHSLTHTHTHTHTQAHTRAHTNIHVNERMQLVMLIDDTSLTPLQ